VVAEQLNANLREELFLQSRLSVPVLHADTVARPRFEAVLAAIRQHPVTLIAAPAGFGKTTLISAWAQRQAIPTAWVSLDAEIADPLRFWAHVAHALETALAGSGASVLQQLDADAADALPQIATLLAHELARHPTPLVLVIDDLHHLQQADIPQQLALLVDHAPASFHVVLLSRSDPPLPLARWRAKGRLLEIRADMLRFTNDEAALLLHQRLGRDLAARAVATLTARTEGWAAGLHLAALMLRDQANQQAVIEGMHGSHRFVIDYLVDEVVSHQPLHIQSFLAETAWLERLSGQLCDAVAGRSDSQVLLEALERANLFIVPLDSQRHWYRYHYLFAECLRAWSRRSHPLDVTQLHRRAAAWWLGQGHPREAIPALLAAEAYAEALPLIAPIGPELVRRGETLTLSRWLDPIPHAALAGFPKLGMAYAWLLLFTHRYDEAESLLRTLSGPAVSYGAVAGEEVVALRDLLVAFRSGQLATSVFERPIFQQIMADYPFIYGVATFVGFERYAHEPLAIASDQPDTWVESLQEIFGQSQLLLQRGQLRAADRLLSGALAQRMGHDNPPMSALLYVAWGDVLLAQNQLARAEGVIEHAIMLALQLGNRHVYLLGLTVRLHLLQALGRAATIPATRAAITEARRDPYVALWVQATILAEQLRHALICADTPTAIAWDAELDMLLASLAEMPGYMRLTVDLVRARAAWDLRRSDLRPQVAAALRSSAEHGWAGRRIEALLLSARMDQFYGDRSAAQAALSQALSLVAADGAIRSVLDAGPDLLDMIATSAQALPISQELREALGPIQGFPAAPVPTAVASAKSLSEPLSDREHDVLRLLAEGLTNRALAARLLVAEGTIKTHLMHIYGKLGVHNRTQAIARAHALGLI
jgi:LuxR family transcriptional regulator, maltose regulon positive regulatory protein